MPSLNIARLKPCSNMGLRDRIGRSLLGLALVVVSPLAFDMLEGGVVAWFAAVFGLANLVSAVFGWCFMYSLVGLSSLDVPQSDDGELVEIDFPTLRRNTVLGFGFFSLLVSVLYISEGYRSAKIAVHRMELGELHNVLDLVSDEIQDELEAGAVSSSFASQNLTKEMLESSLYHFDEPIFLVVYDAAGTLSVGQKLSEPELNHLETTLHSRFTSQLSLQSADEHTHIEDMSANAFSHMDDVHFGWSFHPLENSSAQPAWAILARESISAQSVFREVISRLSISSLLVLWLSTWGAVAVAFFVWRKVELSNRRAVKAANTDSETGLPNERALKDYLERIEKQHRQTSYQVSAVEVRNYSDIVASSGATIASQLYRQLAQSLESAVNPLCKLFRLNSGNILMFAPVSCAECFENFRRAIQQDQQVDNFHFSLETTEVVISYPNDVDTFDDLIVSIASLFHNATLSRTAFLRYDETIIESRQLASKYASEIPHAIAEGQFELYWQPKFDPSSRVIKGAEALIRWNHPQDGLLSPFHFIDIIERSNARDSFACFVIDQVMKSFIDLRSRGVKIGLSFNLNGYDVLEAAVQEKLADVAAALGEDVKFIEVELTESETTLHVDSIAASLNVISGLGYRIALDDFGTGMSSLSYSHILPINTVKIDKSFVDQLTLEPESWLPVKSVLFLAESYGYSVVAEGVENVSQANTLIALGCSLCQGYYFAKPMPFREFRGWFELSVA